MTDDQISQSIKEKHKKRDEADKKHREERDRKAEAERQRYRSTMEVINVASNFIYGTDFRVGKHLVDDKRYKFGEDNKRFWKYEVYTMEGKFAGYLNQKKSHLVFIGEVSYFTQFKGGYERRGWEDGKLHFRKTGGFG